jgi:hypothetical protein
VSLTKLIGDAVVRTLRPGQPRTAVVANRLLGGAGLGSGNARVLNRCDGQGEGRVNCARYGRSQYGGASYA